MDNRHFTKAAILSVAVVLATLIAWEIFLRNKGYNVSYDDGTALWADKRDRIYNKDATVFIGSSRIKFDLDIDTWEELTGSEAVQLAMEGTNPRPILSNLANDRRFNGRLVIDITEGLFFSKSPGRQSEVGANLSFYKDNHTPAQKAGFVLNKQLESGLVFLEKGSFSLNALIDRIKIPEREGIHGFPLFPPDFNRVTYKRQSYMSDKFLRDTVMQNQVKDIWKPRGRRGPPVTGKQLDSIILLVKADIDKIRARGGSVVFVRTPSSGPFLKMEEEAFPRAVYWDKLIAHTNSKGIHFQDDPNTSNYKCPEFSHLSITDAKHYTRILVNSLQSVMNWKFPKSTPIN